MVHVQHHPSYGGQIDVLVCESNPGTYPQTIPGARITAAGVAGGILLPSYITMRISKETNGIPNFWSGALYNFSERKDMACRPLRGQCAF